MRRKIIGVFIISMMLSLTACEKDTNQTPGSTADTQQTEIEQTDTQQADTQQIEEQQVQTEQDDANATEETTLDQDTESSDTVTGEAKVNVASADDELLASYDSYAQYTDDDSEYHVKVIFSTEGVVRDFKFLKLSFVEEDDDIKLQVEEELYSVEELSAQYPVVVDMAFESMIPNRGISYVDENGTVRYFSVQESGEDGSVFLTEIEL